MISTNIIRRMRNIIRGGAKVVSLDKHSVNSKHSSINGKRKRFLQLPFRRKKQGVVVADNLVNSKIGVNIVEVPGPEVEPEAQKEQEQEQQQGQERQLQQRQEQHHQPQQHHQPPQAMNIDADIKTACTLALLSLFPEICPDFLQKTSEHLQYDYESIASHLLDQIDDGKPYPQRSLKRKRVSLSGSGGGSSSKEASINCASTATADIIAALEAADADAADDQEDNADADVDTAAAAREARAVAAFSTNARAAFAANKEYIKQASILLRQAYVKVPQKYIATFLPTHRNCLLPALLALETMVAAGPLPYKEKVRGTYVIKDYAPAQLPDTIRATQSGIVMKDILQEYELALRLREARRVGKSAADRRVSDEAANYAQAEREGAVRECECCCADVPINRMVHCDNAEATHFFCKQCARRMAETQIGLFKYHLACMSMDSCEAGFSHDQRRLFLSRKTTRALERIEQDHVLRVAGLEGLERCPFCPFAAEYPPVEVNKEFTCQNPGCEAVTCRLCQKETHIPKTCDEAERERGDRPSARLLVEEAMSMAMIRSCNKCTTPFIKEQGCNKMTCTNAGCGNVQCYVCHTSCDYSHFDDTTRGGKKGNCPLFESAEKRHEEEVQAAEARAREEVAQKNPGLDMSTLQFDLSDKVLDDERRRRNADVARVAGRI